MENNLFKYLWKLFELLNSENPKTPPSKIKILWNLMVLCANSWVSTPDKVPQLLTTLSFQAKGVAELRQRRRTLINYWWIMYIVHFQYRIGTIINYWHWPQWSIINIELSQLSIIDIRHNGQLTISNYHNYVVKSNYNYS